MAREKKNLPKTLSKLLKIRMMVIVARKNRTVKWKKCKYLIIPTTTLPFSFTVTKQHQINLKCLSFMLHVHQCLCSFLSLKCIQITVPHETINLIIPNTALLFNITVTKQHQINLKCVWSSMLHVQQSLCILCRWNSFKLHPHTKINLFIQNPYSLLSFHSFVQLQGLGHERSLISCVLQNFVPRIL